MTPALDIIIVSYNTREDLLACLETIPAYKPSCEYLTIVVDNASTDGSVEAVRARWPDVHVIALEQNAGFGAANNVAIRASSAPLILVLNSDTLLTAGALDVLCDRLRETGAVAAGPRLVTASGAGGRPEISYGPMLTPVGEVVQRMRQRAALASGWMARRYVAHLLSRERFVDWVSGACLLVRREAALDAGLFDERYFLYEEDVDFCAALRARGGRIVFTPRAEIVHRRGRSRLAAGSRADLEYDLSHLAFYQKHHPAWVPWLRWWLKVRGRLPLQ
jgi:GT2 family glycosyltransferase